MQKILLVIVSGVGILAIGTYTLVRATTAPYIDSITIATTSGGSSVLSINLQEGANTPVYVHGGVVDMDGCADLNLSTLEGGLYRQYVTNGEGCLPNNLNCYQNATSTGSCIINGCNSGSETNVTFQCTYGVAHYADATDTGTHASESWLAWVKIADNQAEFSHRDGGTEINTLTALDVLENVDYGSLALSATSTSDATLVVVNTGNSAIDLDVSGTGLTCANGGVVPVTNQHYSLSSNQTYDTMTALTENSAYVNMSLAKRTNPSVQATSSIFFKLVMPASGLAGTCGGTNTVLARDNL